MNIKKGDTVVIIAGKYQFKIKAGKKERVTGKVISVNKEKNLVVVEGVNKVKKHEQPNQQNQKGKIIEIEAPINASNVAILDPKLKKPTRVGYKIVGEKKVRYAKKSGTVLDK